MDTSSSQQIHPKIIEIRKRRMEEQNRRIADFKRVCKRSNVLATFRRYQTWSLPDLIIYYIIKNPSSPKCYQKLIQSCKYFFYKNPILIVSSLRYCNVWCGTSSKGKSINFKNVSAKLWVTDILAVHNSNGQVSSSTFNSIYQCDAKDIVFYFNNIPFNNLKFLTTKCENIRLNHVTVISENGSVVPVEDVVAALPSVKKFHFHLKNDISKIITSKTAQALIEIPHFPNMVEFDLTEISEYFNIDYFYEYIKKNKKTKIWLDFCADISPAYQIRLQEIVNEILATENRDYTVPFIQFPGDNEPTADALNKLYG